MKNVREKLLISGSRALSDAEVLALVIREGTDALSTIELSGRILAEFGGSLATLAAADVGRIRGAAGCGAVRAVSIAAAAEFARRVSACRGENIDTIASKEDVLRLFAPLVELAHEEFWMLSLASSGRVIERTRVSQGGVSGTVVDHRLMVKRALELLASGVILVHNHPSGSASPSPEDIAITEKVTTAAALFDIAVVDHIIVSRTGNYSFAENASIFSKNSSSESAV